MDEIEILWKQLCASAGVQRQKIFMAYCEKLVSLKEQGSLSEEAAAYRMVGAIQFDDLAQAPEYEAILDLAGVVEIPRTSSYNQPTGQWSTNTADNLKQKEWRELVDAITSARQSLSSNHLPA